MAIMGHQIGKALIDALGLPSQTIGFTLRCYTDEVVTVECEYYTLDDPQHPLATALAEYELVSRQATQVQPGFDNWMRARIDTAHKAMMRRHEVLAEMDARQRNKSVGIKINCIVGPEFIPGISKRMAVAFDVASPRA